MKHGMTPRDWANLAEQRKRYEKMTAEEIYGDLIGKAKAEQGCTCKHSFLLKGCTCGHIEPYAKRSRGY